MKFFGVLIAFALAACAPTNYVSRSFYESPDYGDKVDRVRMERTISFYLAEMVVIEYRSTMSISPMTNQADRSMASSSMRMALDAIFLMEGREVCGVRRELCEGPKFSRVQIEDLDSHCRKSHCERVSMNALAAIREFSRRNRLPVPRE